MSRIDKYEPNIGGTRAPLNAAWTSGDLNTVFAVGLNASGRVVKGAGNTGIIGLLVLTKAKPVGAIVDVMQFCDIVEFPGVAGTVYYGDGVTGVVAAGVAGGGAPASGAGTGAGSKKVGATVEADRLVGRVVI